MDELIEICRKYKNIDKKEMKNINLKIYTKNNFLNNKSCLLLCCTNNNILGPKYFVKRFSITKDEIMIPDKYGPAFIYYAYLSSQLLVIKYLINIYNLTKNDFMKINVNNNNCLHYLFAHNYKTILRHKICLYLFNKYNFTMGDVLTKNKYGSDLLCLCCHNEHYISLKYLIIKYKFTVNDLKYLEKFNYSAKVKKILLINNLLNCINYNYNKIFDLIYK